MAKKPAKPAAKASIKPAVKAPAKTESKAKPPAKAAAKPAEEAASAKKPAVPPKPVPPHQQFLSQGTGRGGPKDQHMAKGRIFRHQGR
jgi:hypothetical protein